jgi:hypothetical protein
VASGTAFHVARHEQKEMVTALKPVGTAGGPATVTLPPLVYPLQPLMLQALNRK